VLLNGRQAVFSDAGDGETVRQPRQHPDRHHTPGFAGPAERRRMRRLHTDDLELGMSALQRDCQACKQTPAPNRYDDGVERAQ
jgi:hypothetical protein